MPFTPDRAAGLQALADFVPKAGEFYAGHRNEVADNNEPSTVSRLSPYLRHRLILESEVLEAVVERHGLKAAGKFIDEVFWRAYFKGWLQQHPDVWSRYRDALAEQEAHLEANAGLAERYEEAVSGRTGIDGFDAWAKELVTCGYLHNHARMWFASIWIFTLKLPWVLGASFFLKHLLDGDPASNTLSWRWVAGLHTRGKHYLARAGNIQRFTGGRYFPENQLVAEAAPLEESRMAAPEEINWPVSTGVPTGTGGWLLSHDDLAPEQGAWTEAPPRPRAVMCLAAPEAPGKFAQSSLVSAFQAAAMADALNRVCESTPGAIARTDQPGGPQEVVDWARRNKLATVHAALAPVGPSADQLQSVRDELTTAGIALVEHTRPHDRMTWPRAGKGFFQLRKHIPEFLRELIPS